jgi:pyrroloquinoline quinone (PQQ) biosynthesis protein C
VGSEQILPTILARMPIDHTLYPIKKQMVENIHSEFFEPDIHPEVNVDMITSGCGITRDAVYGAEFFSETVQVATTLLRLCESSWIEGLAALVWGVEAQSPIQFERQGPALRKNYGFTDTRFPDMHVVMDKDHADSAEEFIRMVITKANMQRVWNAAVIAIESMNDWHDRLLERLHPVPQPQAALRKAAAA